MAKEKATAPTPQITGGRVVFSRSVQPAQYESKKAEVEITFAVPEGAVLGDFLDKAGAMAQDKALELVGLKKGPQVAQPAQEPTKTAPTATPVEPKPAGRTKADLEAEATAKAGGKPAVTMPAISTGEERTDPAQAADEWGAEELVAEAVSDAAMKDACSKRNQVIKKPQAIKALIAEYVAFPKGCADIAQADRPAFLKKLAELK